MTIWPAKDPDETALYTDDWTAQLGDDTIASYIVMPSGTATIAKEQRFAKGLKFWIAGGDDETTTTFAIKVTTASGQVLERDYSIYVASGETNFLPTSTTKRQLIEQMYLECGLNGWEYDISPEETDRALIRLDALMWELSGRGIDIGYNFPLAIGQGDLSDELGCPDQAFFGLAVLGAERLCPTMGKTQSKESRIALASAMKAVRNAGTLAPSMKPGRSTPLGSGNGRWPYNRQFSV